MSETPFFPKCPFCGTPMAKASVSKLDGLFMLSEVAGGDPRVQGENNVPLYEPTGRGWIVELFVCPKCHMMAIRNKEQ